MCIRDSFLNRTAKDIDALTTDDVDIFLTEKKLSGISPEKYNHYPVSYTHLIMTEEKICRNL